MSIESALYRAHAHTVGGREGRAVISGSYLEIKLDKPKELGGAGGSGANPEQLFAAGYGACFIGAMQFVAARDTIQIPAAVSVDATVGIGRAGAGFGIEVELKISLPGLESGAARQLVDKAHEVCPYSNATRNNIDVSLVLI